MKTIKILIIPIAITFLLYGCMNPAMEGASEPQASQAQESNALTRAKGVSDDAVVEFNRWDVSAASEAVEKRPNKPYTIMVYMNGSDLESEEGAATDDLIQMLESGLNSQNANLVIMTGGANRWQNDIVPSNECALWEIKDGLIYEITRIGLLNMGDPGTLAGFIDFGMKNFPADKYGLIMWDHGGGSIVGYGHDEKFIKSNLTLADMGYAFSQSETARRKLEFLGFDSCLMATAEMAVVAADYAKYLVASEDLEPGDGWDYAFLKELNKNPQIEGGKLGKAIVDYTVSYYGIGTDEILTFSVTDLSKTDALADALDGLMKRCAESLSAERASSFRVLAGKRNGTKTFGEGSPRDNDCDMVDIGDMAAKLSDLYPHEAANVLARLSESVIYNRHNSETDIKGLSVYYIYGGKRYGRESLGMYRSLNVNREHASYLESFYDLLVGGTRPTRTRGTDSAETAQGFSREDVSKAQLTLWRPVENEQNAYMLTGIKDTGINAKDISAANRELWPELAGKSVCLYKVSDTQNGSLYAVPAEINGTPCNIMVLVNESNPIGKIMGVRRDEGIIIQKGYDSIKEGDKISLLYQKHIDPDNEGEASVLDSESWYKDEEFTAVGELKLEWRKAEGVRYAAFMLTDIRGNKFITDMGALQ